MLIETVSSQKENKQNKYIRKLQVNETTKGICTSMIYFLGVRTCNFCVQYVHIKIAIVGFHDS